MKDLTNTVVCWNPNGEVVLVPIEAGVSAGQLGFVCSTGANCADIRGFSREERIALIYKLAIQMIVRDCCNPQTVHKALLGFDEYVAGLPRDMLPAEMLDAYPQN